MGRTGNDCYIPFFLSDINSYGCAIRQGIFYKGREGS